MINTKPEERRMRDERENMARDCFSSETMC